MYTYFFFPFQAPRSVSCGLAKFLPATGEKETLKGGTQLMCEVRACTWPHFRHNHVFGLPSEIASWNHKIIYRVFL